MSSREQTWSRRDRPLARHTRYDHFTHPSNVFFAYFPPSSWQFTSSRNEARQEEPIIWNSVLFPFAHTLVSSRMHLKTICFNLLLTKRFFYSFGLKLL